MVDQDGRLIILDFGLALGDSGIAVGEAGVCVGTPKYMAPEQAAGEPATPMSDWYAVGCLLYEALANVPPFTGAAYQIMREKRMLEAKDVREICPGVPGDIATLSMALLEIEAGHRPVNAGDLLRRIADPRAEQETQIVRMLPEVSLVGRTEQLALLEQARRQVDDHKGTAVLLVHGASGIGKTALVNHFVSGVQDDRHLVLRSRCYQNESLPFKALDGLADALGEYLNATDQNLVTSVLPHQVQYLARLFPTLRLVPVIERMADDVVATLDPHEMRRRGFQALRELLHRLAERKRLLITIDDIQWGDEDSVNALVEVLAPPAPPSLMLVMCARSDDTGPVVAQARKAMAQSGIALIDVELGPLSGSEVDELTRRLIRQRGQAAPEAELIAAVHRECGGHPLLLHELVLAGGPDSGEQHPTLRVLLERRLAALPALARRLLECAAIAGRPRPLALLMGAIGEGENLAAAMHLLAGERLIRMRGVGGRDEVTVYHDKVAEISLQLIDEERTRAYHLSLAAAITGHYPAAQEADALAMHYLAGGDREKAVHHSLIAADHAASTLAFDRAADLYRIILGLLPPGSERPDLQLKLADALAYAGHGPEAARAYLCAAATPERTARLHALDRAAGQFLRSGYMDDGLKTARQVLGEVGVPWHASSTSALLSLLYRRLRMRWRGIAFTERKAEDIPADGLVRMDVLWSLGHGLGGVDTVRGAEFHARHLLMALDCGDPYRISRGLAWEAILTSAEGGARGRQRARLLIETGHALARRLGSEHASAWNWAAEAYSYWCEGRWNEALSCCTEAARLYREKCLDITWELGSVYAWCWLPVLCYSGKFGKLRELVTQVDREFGQLGDLYTLVTVATVVKPWLALLDGDPARARAESAQAVGQWSREHWHLQHLFDLMTRARTLLYEGDGAAALQALERDWPRYRATMQDRLQLKRMFMHGLRAQAVVMACAQGTVKASRVREAALYARKLEGEGTRWAAAYGASVRAAILALGQGRAQARDAYLAVAADFHELGLVVHAGAARRRAAELAVGAQAAAELEAADEQLRALGASDPARFSAAYVAGAPPRG